MISFLKILTTTVLDAIFPVSPAEKKLFSLSKEVAYATLPRAPKLNAYSTPTLIPYFSDISCLFAYKDEVVTQLIWNIKYKKSSPAVSIAAYAIHRELQNKLMDKTYSSQTKIILIPMPITDHRRRERGFNQCELIVDEISKIDTEKRLLVDKNLLIRTTHASRQTLKGRVDRLESAKGIFAVDKKVVEIFMSPKGDISDIQIILIDDVITTGSTIKEAIETLKRVGFKNIRGISVAH